MPQVTCNSVSDRDICHHCSHAAAHHENSECRERCYEPSTGTVIEAECEVKES